MRLEPETRVLDLGIRGTGVDLSPLFTEQAKARAGSILLIGETDWHCLPPTDAVVKGCLAHIASDFHELPELLASFDRLVYDVVEMVLADENGWDRYEAAKWLTMRR